MKSKPRKVIDKHALLNKLLGADDVYTTYGGGFTIHFHFDYDRENPLRDHIIGDVNAAWILKNLKE